MLADLSLSLAGRKPYIGKLVRKMHNAQQVTIKFELLLATLYFQRLWNSSLPMNGDGRRKMLTS